MAAYRASSDLASHTCVKGINGIGNGNGMCAQGALTANSEAFGALINAAVKKIETDAALGAEYTRSVMALNASSVQTAYANIGFFYACQIILNDLSRKRGDAKLTNADTISMFRSVGNTAKHINIAAVNLATLAPNDLKAIRELMIKLGADPKKVPEDDAELVEQLEETKKELIEESAPSTPEEEDQNGQ